MSAEKANGSAGGPALIARAAHSQNAPFPHHIVCEEKFSFTLPSFTRAQNDQDRRDCYTNVYIYMFFLPFTCAAGSSRPSAGPRGSRRRAHRQSGRAASPRKSSSQTLSAVLRVLLRETMYVRATYNDHAARRALENTTPSPFSPSKLKVRTTKKRRHTPRALELRSGSEVK